MREPLVSIITIVYNQRSSIENTMQSVLQQTYKFVEYIVIDGGSTDGTTEIIEKYQKYLSYWCSEKDNGIADAFNKGISKAKGEVIGILNASDWYEADAVEKAVENLSNADIVHGQLGCWNQNVASYVQEGNHMYLKREMTINHPTVFIRKQCYDNWGLFNEKYKVAMDYDLLLRFFLKGARIEYIPSLMTNMQMDGVSTTSWLKGCRETFHIKNEYMPQKKTAHRLYFYRHVFIIWITRFLSFAGLRWFIKQYRQLFSVQRKNYSFRRS